MIVEVPFQEGNQPQDSGEQAQIEAVCMRWLEAIMAAPVDPEPLCRLAMALQELGEFGQALPLWQQAEGLAASSASIEILMGQGRCLEKMGLDQEAIALAERACIAHPNQAAPYRLLGFLHWRGGRYGQAEGPWRQALALEPENPLNVVNIAGILNGLNRLDEAIIFHQQAIQLAPELMNSWVNLAITQRRLADFDGAEATLNEALLLEPANSQVRWCLALTRLMRGDYLAAWPDFDQRFSVTDPSELVADPGGQRWLVAPDSRIQTLLLMAEQGMGDIIQFCRYAPLMRRFANRVELCVPEPLLKLIADADLADAVITPERLDERSGHDWMPLLTTAAVLGVTVADPLVPGPHLRVDPKRLDFWRQRLPRGPERLIAVNWQGNPQTELLEGFRGRSMPLELLAPLAALPGIRLVSLQKGPGLEQRERCSFRDRFVEVQTEIDCHLDFADVAAVMACCDLVVSTDTVIPHLAGSLGLPVWILLKWAPDWRWGFEGETSHWYPSMRLFRQASAGTWQDPVDRLVEELEPWLEAQPPAGPGRHHEQSPAAGQQHSPAQPSPASMTDGSWNGPEGQDGAMTAERPAPGRSSGDG